MKHNYKKFKPFEQVIVKALPTSKWSCDLYSHYDCEYGHETIKYRGISDSNILTYKGNEYLVGILDEPEEIILEIGEPIVICPVHANNNIENFLLRKYEGIKPNGFIDNVDGTLWLYVIRFDDFNPDDLTESKKHILSVKNGKIIKSGSND